MVALKDYRPNNLSINPFQLGQEIAKPYDYDGALKEMMNWQQLTNQEATTDFNQLKAEEAQREADFSEARKAEIEKRIGEGGDPSEFKMSDVEKVIGNTEGYLKLKTEERKALQDSQDRNLKIRSTINTVGKTNPIYAAQLANEFGIGDFRAPIQKGDKGDKPAKPKTQLWTDGTTTRDVDVNDPNAVRQAAKDKFFNLKDFDLAQNMGLTKQTEEEPEDTRGFFSRLNGDESGNKAVNPGNTSSPPPGMKLQRNKATGEVRMVPINGR